MNKSSHRILKISQNSQENTCDRDSFIIKLQVKACNFIKKETLAQVFSCEFCEIPKSIFFTEHFWVTPSKNSCCETIDILFPNIR